MHTWFECKIRYEKTMENGMNKKVTEPYLVDALSFTEAEARIIEEMTPVITGEFIVSDIKRANYSELFPSEEEAADRWFKCKLVFITLDEKSGAEKKTSTQVLVQAADLRDAVKKLDEGMKGTMADYQIASVAETALMDVYPYHAEPDDYPEVQGCAWQTICGKSWPTCRRVCGWWPSASFIPMKPSWRPTGQASASSARARCRKCASNTKPCPKISGGTSSDTCKPTR